MKYEVIGYNQELRSHTLRTEDGRQIHSVDLFVDATFTPELFNEGDTADDIYTKEKSLIGKTIEVGEISDLHRTDNIVFAKDVELL